MYTRDPSSTLESDCAGVVFSEMNPDGSDVQDIAAYAYDAVLGMAVTLNHVMYVQNKVNFTGTDIVNIVLGGTHVNYTGATGYIEFFTGFGGSMGYGFGDRQTDLTYKVLNFNPIFFHRHGKTPDLSIRSLGTWKADTNVFIPCNMDYDEYCTEEVFNTVDGLILDDSATVLEVKLTSVTKTYLRVGGGMTLGTCLLYCFMILLFLDSRVIKAGQPVIIFTVLLGGMLGGVQILLMSYDITDDMCVAGMWAGHLAFALAFSALLAKTLRISRIMKGAFSKVKVTARHMYSVMMGGMFLFCAVLAVDTVIGRPHRWYDESFDGHRLVRLIKCQNTNPNVTLFLFVLEGFVLFYGAKLCWDARNAPGAVNDSTEISFGKL